MIGKSYVGRTGSGGNTAGFSCGPCVVMAERARSTAVQIGLEGMETELRGGETLA